MTNVEQARLRAAQQEATLTPEQRAIADALVQQVRDVLAQYKPPTR